MEQMQAKIDAYERETAILMQELATIQQRANQSPNRDRFNTELAFKLFDNTAGQMKEEVLDQVKEFNELKKSTLKVSAGMSAPAKPIDRKKRLESAKTQKTASTNVTPVSVSNGGMT